MNRRPPIDLPDALAPLDDAREQGWGPFLRYDVPAMIACIAIAAAWALAVWRLP
jgi:hypothetical protein